MRPKLVKLKEGLALGNPMHKGFAACWNWLISWVKKFATGAGIVGSNGIKVTGGTDGEPYTISGADIEGGSLTGNVAGSTAVSGDCTFASASDSNVKISTDKSTGTITIGVYYV